MLLGVVVVMILVSCSVFVNGWTDAPNAIATVVSTRVMRPRAAVMMAAAFNLLGVLLSGSAVAVTVSNIVSLDAGKQGLITLAAAQFSIVLWSTVAWKFGLPTSESHGLIAGLTGAGLATTGLATFTSTSWGKILYGLAISSVLGFFVAVLVTWIIIAIFRHVRRSAANKFFSWGQVASAALMAYNHGAQDGQKFLGIFALALMLGGVVTTSDLNNLWWPKLCISAVMCLGTSIGGYRIISKMGMEMVKLEKYQGFSAEIGASALMFFATALGIPLSTTQTKATSIMGAGAARSLRNVNWSIVKEMFIAWGLTFPICIAIGFIMTKLFMLIF